MERHVNWFEIPVKNLERATKFYENVFEIKLKHEKANDVEMGLFPMPKEESPGAFGALVYGQGIQPSNQGVTIYFSCEDLSKELSRVEKKWRQGDSS